MHCINEQQKNTEANVFHLTKARTYIMKKITLTKSLALLCAVTLCIPVTADAAAKKISKTKAKEIALSHAELKESEVTFTKIKLDKDDGTVLYDIEFYVDGDEYDYEINAYTGKIIEYDFDAESHKSKDSVSSFITKTQAKDIVLTHAGLKNSEVTFTKTKLDRDDNTYELEFYNGKTEYDYEINAKTGEIIEFDSDAESYTPSKNTKLISASKAYEIALKHAGISKDDVSEYKCKKDRDDGITIYEVKFVTDDYVEYEYEIKASNGKIISWESDMDD